MNENNTTTTSETLPTPEAVPTTPIKLHLFAVLFPEYNGLVTYDTCLVTTDCRPTTRPGGRKDVVYALIDEVEADTYEAAFEELRARQPTWLADEF